MRHFDHRTGRTASGVTMDKLPCGCLFHPTDATKDVPCPRHADKDLDLAPTMVPHAEKPLPEETEDLE